MIMGGTGVGTGAVAGHIIINRVKTRRREVTKAGAGKGVVTQRHGIAFLLTPCISEMVFRSPYQKTTGKGDDRGGSSSSRKSGSSTERPLKVDRNSQEGSEKAAKGGSSTSPWEEEEEVKNDSIKGSSNQAPPPLAQPQVPDPPPVAISGQQQSVSATTAIPGFLPSSNTPSTNTNSHFSALVASMTAKQGQYALSSNGIGGKLTMPSFAGLGGAGNDALSQKKKALWGKKSEEGGQVSMI